MERTYAEYAAHQAVELLAIDSPTGFTRQAAEWVLNAFRSLGYEARTTVKGGVLIDLGGSDENDGLLLEAHADTLGGMVAEIKGNGRLQLTALGGMRPENGEAENVRVYTRSGRVIEGTFQLCNASVHVNGEYANAKRSYDTCEVVLDEDHARRYLAGDDPLSRRAAEAMVYDEEEDAFAFPLSGGRCPCAWRWR